MYVPRHLQNTVSPVWAEVQGNNVLVRWQYRGDLTAPTFKVLLDGVPHGDTTANQMAMSLKPGKSYRIDVLAMSAIEAKADFSGFVAVPSRGSRLRLSIPKVDLAANPDFQSYLVYMSDDGSEPTELLAELRGANNNSFSTSPLEDGKTYKFRLALRDAHGNQTDYGPTVSGKVNTYPEPVVRPALTWDQATRKASIAATKPASQDADATSYRFYSNYDHAWGSLLPDLHLDRPVAEIAPSQPVSWTTPELCEGLHLFAVRACDGSGLESSYETLSLNLARSGGALAVVPVPPPRPYRIDAEPVSGGRLKVTVKLDEPEKTDAVNVYIDGALDGTVQTGGAQIVEYLSTPLAHGRTCSVSATALAGSAESQASDAATATADAEPPSGSLTISLTLVD